jgi:hypothetical protein
MDRPLCRASAAWAASMAALRFSAASILVSCADESPAPSRAGAAMVDQTADQSSTSAYPVCSLNEDYGPGAVRRVHNCRGTVQDPLWSLGNPTPAGRYVCICAQNFVSETIAASCDEALAEFCGVDLATPQPCGRAEGAACWPVQGDGDAWRCRCTSSDDEALSNQRADTCVAALDAACGVVPTLICPDAGARHEGSDMCNPVEGVPQP